MIVTIFLPKDNNREILGGFTSHSEEIIKLLDG